MRLPRHILGALVLCSIPYVGLLSFVLIAHTDTQTLHHPEPLVLLVLVVVGALLPLGRLAFVLRWLTLEAESFRLDLLMQSYVSLLLVFASLYALLNVGSSGVAFEGMVQLWGGHETGTLEHHVLRLHHVFADALYFSVMTMTTVGYGDITPTSGLARALTMAQAIMGMGFWGVSVGQYFAYRTRHVVQESEVPTAKPSGTSGDTSQEKEGSRS